MARLLYVLLFVGVTMALAYIPPPPWAVHAHDQEQRAPQ